MGRVNSIDSLKMYRLLICAFLICTVKGEIIQDVPCDLDSVNPVTNLNITAMLGEWRQLKRIPNSMESGACSTLTIEIHKNGTEVHTALTHREVVAHVANVRLGEIVPIDTYKFTILYQNISFDSVIAATDYSKYALIYSCKDTADNKSSVVAWVYSRSYTLQQVEEDTNFKTAFTNITALQNATWIEPNHDSEACTLNSANVFNMSPIAIVAMFIISKVSFVTN